VLTEALVVVLTEALVVVLTEAFALDLCVLVERSYAQRVDAIPLLAQERSAGL
jgi:hypothetical protein